MTASSSVVRDKSERAGPEFKPSPPARDRARSFTTDLSHHPSYRPDIDGLRCLAIVLVVIFHAFPRVLPGGFVGVDIFFVISGFLISSIIFKGLQRDSFSFPAFYANRIKRIFPALLLVLSASAVFGWFFLFPGEYLQLGKHIMGGVAFLENVVLRRETGYFDTRSFLKPLMHLWSLGIEEQFYLTYPFLLWAAWRLRCNVLAVLGSLVLISFSLNVWAVGRDPAAGFFLPQTRFWELWIGGVLAYFDILKPAARKTEPGSAIASNALSIAGVAMVGAALLVVHERTFPGWWALLPVCGASLLTLAGPAAWFNREILSHPVAVFVGLISYPLYLWHWPILSFARMMRGEELSVGGRIAAIALSLLLAWATWRFVESPIRFGRRIWLKTAALALISVIVGCIGYTIHYRRGFDGRFENLTTDSVAELPATRDCGKTVGVDKPGYCEIFGAGSPAVLLIGDSHAGALSRGLGPAYAQRSQVLMSVVEPGCVPFYDVETYDLKARQEKDCRPRVNRMLEFATSSPSVRTVILEARGPLYMSGLDIGENADAVQEVVSWNGAPKNSSQAEAYAAAFRNTVARLLATGKTVVLFLDWPELGFDPRSCLPRPVPLFSRVRALCGVPRAQVDARNRAYREIIFDLQKEFSGLRVFDPLPYLCDATACYAMRTGQFLYRDGNHLSDAGSAYLARAFLAEQPGLSPQ